MSQPSVHSERRIAIIAALEREIAPLVRGWKKRRVAHNRADLTFWESPNAIAVAGGIGMPAARRSTEMAVSLYDPRSLASAGLAGSLSANLHVGDLIRAIRVIDAATGRSYPASDGKFEVVTAAKVSGLEDKRKLAELHHAHAVDMEAAAVAEIAQREGLSFFAIKAISDDFDFAMPPLDQFINPDGSLSTLKFAIFAALRPRLWPGLVQLSRNSNRAIQALTPALRHLIDTHDFGQSAIESKKTVPASPS